MTTSPITTTKPTVVLVGYGMVGHRFLEALADTGAADRFRVVVLAEEPRPAYDRVALTSYFAGKTPEDLLLGEPGFLDAHGFEVHLDSPVTAIDRAGRTVTTAAGHTVAYDTLVLATGSYPFVPPVEGRDAAGCFVYRTIEDLHAIEAYAAGARVGAVVGGGLLGLEAAGALKGLGLETHVVEFAPRLMPVQVDEGGGEALRRTIEEMGVTVHTGVGTSAILTTDGAASGMTFTDGSAIGTDLVVFSAGIRPRDQLARDCGLTVGERGGIAVDAHCRTSDEHVYAIGECALAVDGRVYGLVAPGYEMAATVAHRLAGQAAQEFTGADLSTKLKLLGVDVASFGDAFGTTAGALDVVYSDARSGIYKKLVVTPEGALLGGILVGDAEAYATLRPLAGTGTPLPVPAESLVLPAGLGAPVQLGTSALPDDAVVCSCHNVTKGTVRGAVTDHQCTTVPEVKKCTKAGTGCGSCVKLLSTLVTEELEASGVVVDKGLCACFAHTRAELYEIVRVKRIPTHRQLLAEHGRLTDGEGCEVCKPTVASIIATLAPELTASGYVLDGEQAALQDTNDHFLANLQKNGSYSIVPRVPGGEITPEKLIVIGEVARDFGLYTKLTGGQRIDLFGARVDQLPQIWQRLVEAGFESGHAYGKSLRTVKSCVGSTWCRYGVQDSVGMAIRLELRYRGLRSPHKFKSGVSGCARECAEAQSKDFGVIATSNGWNLYVGGNGGATPRHADLLAQDLDDETLIRYVDRFLMFYIRTADRLERTSGWLERIEGGLDHVRDVVVHDSLGIAADLEALMERHVGDYRDEWAATLADPERLSRFVSFVNAPGVPDPSIRFTAERDQVKPDLEILATPEQLLAKLSADLLEVR
ncbi:nitrite reductase large subunit NirB [Kitasatospora sp. NPDC096147]|uniref:nitrite reductase large subunit NirB n=1 Tax=Kitasatospora sp. NPDC096147 TaxID=3364093 RepID=UPI0037FF9783